MALDRKCIVCPDKHHYKYCNNCNGYNSLETWRFIFCSENCKEIYQVASDFVNGQLSSSDAKEKLTNLDISDLEFYHSIIKQNIMDILASENIEKQDIDEEKIENKDELLRNETVKNDEVTVSENKLTNSYHSRKQKNRKR